MRTIKCPLVNEGWVAVAARLPISELLIGHAIPPDKSSGGPILLTWNEQGKAFHPNGMEAPDYNWKVGKEPHPHE